MSLNVPAVGLEVGCWTEIFSGAAGSMWRDRGHPAQITFERRRRPRLRDVRVGAAAVDGASTMKRSRIEALTVRIRESLAGPAVRR